jgi:hypothetical protein
MNTPTHMGLVGRQGLEDAMISQEGRGVVK